MDKQNSFAVDSSAIDIKEIVLPTNQATIACFYSHIPQEPEAQTEFVAGYKWLLPEKLKSAQHGRQAEFITGRLLAQEALGKHQIRSHIVRQNSDGSPAWPEGIRGSISHKKELAIAAVTRESDFIGIDLENLITDKNARKLAKRIVNEQEQDLMEATDISFGENFTRIFSAKEALYKAIYPSVRRYLPFSICQVTAISNDVLTLQLIPDICQEIQRNAPFNIQTFDLADKTLTLASGYKDK